MIQGYVEVSLPPPVARELTYGVPAELAAEARPGALVLVPVVQRRLTGIVLGPTTLGDIPPCKIRPIEQILDTSLLSPEVVALCRWMASYYMAPLGQCPDGRPASRRQTQLQPPRAIARRARWPPHGHGSADRRRVAAQRLPQG